MVHESKFKIFESGKVNLVQPTTRANTIITPGEKFQGLLIYNTLTQKFEGKYN